MALYTIEDGYTKKDWRNYFFRFGLVISLLSVLIGFGLFTNIYNKRPSSNGVNEIIAPTVSAEATKIKLVQPVQWPNYGQTAYGVVGEGVLASSTPQQTAVPTASLAKIITALAVLKQRPLQTGQQGQLITISQDDIAIYENYVRNDGAVVPVELGEQLTQYQALQAMLLPSANNISDALVKWAFGSNEKYVVYANKMLKDMNINNTSVADASGFSASSVSTAHDMTLLGIEYLQNPVLNEIAQQTEATIPFAGIIKNYNSTLNEDGILGIKIGNTDEAGKCFVVAHIRGDGKPTSVVAVLGASTMQAAMADAVATINSGNTSYDVAAATQP